MKIPYPRSRERGVRWVAAGVVWRNPLSVSTFIREVATYSRDRISLPAGGIRQLGWTPGDRLLVQRLDEDMVLLMRRPKKSTEHISEETYEGVPDAGDEAEELDTGGEVALEPPEAALSDGPSEARPTDGQPMASATALLERLEQRIAALERLLANEPTSAEAGGPTEEPTESTMEDEEVGPEAASPAELTTNGMALEELTQEESTATDAETSELVEEDVGPEESEMEGAGEQPVDGMDAEGTSPAEPKSDETQVHEAMAVDTQPEQVATREAVGQLEEPAGVTEGVESGEQTGGSAAEHDAAGAGVAAATGVEAGSAAGGGARLQAGVALQLFADMLRHVMPEETMGHLEAGRREGLLALRSLLAAGIERIDAMKDVEAATKGATDGI